MRYRICHTINTDADTFWKRIFFDDAYNKALFSDHLKFSDYRVLEFHTDPDGTIRKRAESKPPIELPKAFTKVVGELSGYVETGVYDPKTGHYRVDVVPSTAADKVKTYMDVWVESRGDKRIERIVEVDNDIKIFGIGKLVEKFIEQQMRTTYEAAAVFTNRWIAEKGL